MPWTVVSSKLRVNFITVIVYYVFLQCALKQVQEVQIEHLFVHNTTVILLAIYIIIAASLDRTSQKYTEQSNSNHGYYMYVNSEVTGTTKVIHVPAFGSMLWITP